MNDGEATVRPFGGTGTNYAFQWSDNQPTATAQNLAPGWHYVTVSDENDCEKIDSILIRELDSLRISVVVDTPNCSGENSGALGVTFVSGGSGTIDPNGFRWDNGDVGQYIGNLEGNKNYTVTVTDGQGCSNFKTVYLPDTEAITFDVKVEDVKCFGGNDGLATIENVLNAKGNVRFQWDVNTGGQTGATSSSLTAGTYFVTLTDGNNCATSGQVIVEQPTPIEINFAVKDNDCFGDSKGAITATATGGTPAQNGGYAFSWSNNAQGAAIQNLASGIFTVTVTDGNNCEVTGAAQIAESDPIDAVLTPEGTSCHGSRDGKVSVETFGGVPPYLYSFDGRNFVGSNILIGLTAGEYDIFIKDGKGCLWVDKATVIEPPVFEVDAGPEFVEIQLGTTTTLVGQSLNAQGTVVYNWDALYDGTLSCEICDSTVANPIYSTIYTLFGTDGNGCRASDKIEVRVLKTRTVLVPTGFTPNQDGANDVLMIHGREGTKIKVFRIYDRWGELVYEVADFDINDQNAGWDGNFRGQAMNSGVYAWYLEVEYMDGAQEQFYGQTTLIR